MLAQDGGLGRVSIAQTRPRESDAGAVAIVERGLVAIGGRGVLSRLTSLARTGTIRAEGQEGFFGEWYVLPSRRRVELFYPQAGWITVVDGNRVERRVGGGFVTMQGAERGEWLLRASPWPELRAKELNIIYELAGEIEVDGRRAQGVRGTFEFGPGFGETVAWVDYYDCESGRLARRDDGDGAAVRSTVFEHYKENAGLWTPSRITRRFGKRETVYEFKQIEVGADIRAEWFNTNTRRTDEPLVVGISAEKLHREPFDTAMRYDRVVARIALPNAVCGADTEISARIFDGARVVISQTVSATTARPDDATGVPRLPLQLIIPSDEFADRMEITVIEKSPPARKCTISRPVDRNHNKTDLVFPLRMPALVVAGHDLAEHHARERSQLYSYDLAGCDFDGNVFVDGAPGAKNENYTGFGMEVIAPAPGKVVFARDGIPDNERPGEIGHGDQFLLDGTAIFGNCIIIDHGNGEFSLVGHLQKNSVAVKEGDAVERGAALGLLGNSGWSTAPHLHYHLMDGSKFFESDGIPVRFTGVLEFQTGQRMPILRTGSTAKPVGPTALRPGSRPASQPAESKPVPQSASKPAVER